MPEVVKSLRSPAKLLVDGYNAPSSQMLGVDTAPYEYMEVPTTYTSANEIITPGKWRKSFDQVLTDMPNDATTGHWMFTVEAMVMGSTRAQIYQTAFASELLVSYRRRRTSTGEWNSWVQL